MRGEGGLIDVPTGGGIRARLFDDAPSARSSGSIGASQQGGKGDTDERISLWNSHTRNFAESFSATGSGIHETPALKEEEEIRSTRVLEKSAEHIKANAHTMYMHM